MLERRLPDLVRQHAMTSLLLGVDFVPSYRSGIGLSDAALDAAPDAKVEVEVEVEVDAKVDSNIDPEVESAQGLIEAKPTPVSDADPRAEAVLRLDELRERYVAEAPHEQFVTDFKNIVFGEGDPCARLMFIGEAPGAEEDKTGRPFVGRAGQLLDRMIVAMGLQREDVYIANVLKTRPPNNQTPTTDEARLCAPYLFEQIRIISPEVIVTLGRPASQLLLGSSGSMGRLRGRWAEFPPAEPLIEVGEIGPIPVMPTYHPAFLLRQYTADNRAKVWSDLRDVMELLGLIPAGN